jgi:dienelactone hydrolase
MSALALGGHFATALPAPSGPFPVGVATLELAREPAAGASPGTFEVELWYPSATAGERAPYGTGRPGFARLVYHSVLRSHATRDAPLARGDASFPLVLYVAGWGGQRTDNTILAEELASHGFVVAAFGDLIHDDPPLEPLAAPADFSSQAAYEATLRLAHARIAYLSARASAVLDELHRLECGAGTPRFAGRLRASEAGIVGYSFGGAVALAACGRDPRFSAAVDIDGWLFGVRNERRRPYFLIADDAPPPAQADLTSEDLSHRYQSILTLADHATQRDALASGGYALAVAGAEHLDFTDAPSYMLGQWRRRASIDPKRMMRLLNRYVRAFLEHHVAAKPSALLADGAGFDSAARLTRYGPTP